MAAVPEQVAGQMNQLDADPVETKEWLEATKNRMSATFCAATQAAAKATTSNKAFEIATRRAAEALGSIIL